MGKQVIQVCGVGRRDHCGSYVETEFAELGVDSHHIGDKVREMDGERRLGSVINPYRRGGCYGRFVILEGGGTVCGVNELHAKLCLMLMHEAKRVSDREAGRLCSLNRRRSYINIS